MRLQLRVVDVVLRGIPGFASPCQHDSRITSHNYVNSKHKLVAWVFLSLSTFHLLDMLRLRRRK